MTRKRSKTARSGNESTRTRYALRIGGNFSEVESSTFESGKKMNPTFELAHSPSLPLELVFFPLIPLEFDFAFRSLPNSKFEHNNEKFPPKRNWNKRMLEGFIQILIWEGVGSKVEFEWNEKNKAEFEWERR
jgi:hypothetical protein